MCWGAALPVSSASVAPCPSADRRGCPAPLAALPRFFDGALRGAFAAPPDVTISGFAGFNATLGSDADSLFLNLAVIPEPSTALLAVLGELGLLLRRRR